MRCVGGAAGGGLPAFRPQPLGPRCVPPAGVLQAVLGSVVKGWVAAGGLAGMKFCVHARLQMSDGGLVSWVFVSVCSAPLCGMWDLGFGLSVF